MSEKIIPPPPLFKPNYALNNSDTAVNRNSQQHNSYNDSNNYNYLTTSFVDYKDYKKFKYLKNSPIISPLSVPLDKESSNKFELININSNIKKRKRRKASNSIEEEKERKRELKIQHSIIEKKRRIKINREFESLKFLVPACREEIIKGFNENKNFENSNTMHKLTILQSTVEYIKYLHFIIKIVKPNLKFTKIDDLLDLKNVRNIENDFNFEDIYLSLCRNNAGSVDDNEEAIEEEEVEEGEEEEVEVEAVTEIEIEEEKRKLVLENIKYKQMIMASQKDTSVFKLPPPAIIDKYLNATINNKSIPRTRFFISNGDSHTQNHIRVNSNSSSVSGTSFSSDSDDTESTSRLLLDIKRRASIENMLN